MSILTGAEILRQIKLGRIVIDPFDEKKLGANSYDLTLGNKLLVYDMEARIGIPSDDVCSYRAGEEWVFSRVLDMKKDNPTTEVTIPPEGYVLKPDTLYLGHTIEYTETVGFAPMVEGRSSVGRLGLSIHQTAGFGDNCFCGDWTLEIVTVHPVRIYVGVKVGQIFYHTLVGDETRTYDGKYQGQRGPKASRMFHDFFGANHDNQGSQATDRGGPPGGDQVGHSEG